MQGNSPVVAFIDQAGGDLEYAHLNNNAFVSQELDTANASGPVSMAQIDSFMAIAYIDSGKLEVFDSLNDGQNWGFNSSLPNTINATYCALAVAPATKGDLTARRIHVIYYDGATGRYSYTTDDTDTGVWITPETIYQSALNTISYFGLSIAVGSDKVPQVAFLDYDSKRLAYAKRVSGAWTAPEFPDGANLGGVNASLKLTSSGSPRIAYGALTFNSMTSSYVLAGLKYAQPATPVSALRLTVADKARRTATKSSITIRGAATGATRVEWRVGKRPFKRVTVSGGKWRAICKPLRVGRNRLEFRAVSASGQKTSVRRVTVLRKS